MASSIDEFRKSHLVIPIIHEQNQDGEIKQIQSNLMVFPGSFIGFIDSIDRKQLFLLKGYDKWLEFDSTVEAGDLFVQIENEMKRIEPFFKELQTRKHIMRGVN